MPGGMELGGTPVDNEISRRITEYYSREASELPPADPDEMTINIRDIIQTAKDKKVAGEVVDEK